MTMKSNGRRHIRSRADIDGVLQIRSYRYFTQGIRSGFSGASLLRVAVPFAIAGLIAGAICAPLVLIVVGEQHYPKVLGFKGLWNFALIPLVSSMLSFLFSYGLVFAIPRLPIGAVFGMLAAAISFVTFALLLSLYVAGFEFAHVFAGFAVFGGLFLGWIFLGIGAATGFIVGRRLRNRRQSRWHYSVNLGDSTRAEAAIKTSVTAYERRSWSR